MFVVSVMEVDHECVLQPNKPLYKLIHVKERWKNVLQIHES